MAKKADLDAHEADTANPHSVTAAQVGSVAGPSTSTLNAVPRFSNTTGDILKDSVLTVSDAGSVVITSADAGAGPGPQLILDRNSASPAASDILGTVSFQGRDAGAGTDTYARISAEIVDPTAGSEDGRFVVETKIATTLSKRFFVGAGLYSSGATGGDQGADTINASGVFDDGVLLTSGGITLGTEVATTSGTVHDFTGLPAGIKRIIITLEGVSLSGTDNILVQLGDAGGFEATGYISSSVLLVDAGSVGVSSDTTGFIMNRSAATDVFSGQMILTLSDSANNTWIASHSGKHSVVKVCSGGGDKSLSAELTQVRITRTGTDTFDAGAVNIQHQS